LWEAGSADRSKQVRAEIEREFILKTVEKYGENVLNTISLSDIATYCIDVEAGGDEYDLWYSVLQKYDLDQTTDSCLYFIKQGTATKIGITNSLNSRFSQIKTSAAFPCKMMNVVYTHTPRKIESALLQAHRPQGAGERPVAEFTSLTRSRATGISRRPKGKLSVKRPVSKPWTSAS
jgi:hypothetical protein